MKKMGTVPLAFHHDKKDSIESSNEKNPYGWQEDILTDIMDTFSRKLRACALRSQK
jgi:hypothetical protein